MIMRDLRMTVSLPANEAKECRPGERAGARNTTSRDGLSSLISFNPLSRYERSLRSFSQTCRSQVYLHIS